MSLRHLNLQVDYRDEDAIDELERAFGVVFSPEETARWRTVGDVESDVVARFDHSQGSKCATSMAFYRVKRSLAAGNGPARLSPSSKLVDLTARARRNLARELAATAGLHAPSFNTGRLDLAWIGIVSSTAVIFVSAVAGWLPAFIAGLFWLIVSIPLAILVSRRFPSGMTVGDLSRAVVDWNVARFAEQGGRIDNLTARRATRRILAWASGERLEDLQRDTRLYR